MKPPPHLQPISARAVLERCAPGRRYLLARGQYSPSPTQAQRIVLFAQRGWRLEMVADAWLTPAEAAQVGAALQAIPAGCDAMYATRPVYLWARVGELLSLWRHGFPAGRFSRAQLQVRSLLRWSTLPVDHFVEVRGFLSADWSRRGVALVAQRGARRVVAQTTEWAAVLDPTYDGLDLLGDTGWVVELARAVAEAAGLPLVLDADL